MREDVRPILERHYARLGPISATGVKAWVFSTTTDPEVLETRARLDEGALLEWRQEQGTSYRLHMDPAGKPLHKALTRDGWTTRYEYESRHGNRVQGYETFGGVSPCVYFLQIAPVSFLEHLSTARERPPSEAERSLGATDVLEIVHPELDPETMVRIAIDRQAPRILRVELSYESGGRQRLLVRYTFDGWTRHRGEAFPLAFTLEFLDKDGDPRDVMSLSLSEPSSEPVPAELTVPAGSTFGDAGVDGGTSLIGRLSGEELAAKLSDLHAWAQGRPAARLFVGSDFDLGDARDVLEAWRPAGEEVSLSSLADYDCGPNALALAMSLLRGGEAPLDVIESEIRIGPEGVTPAELMAAAEGAGFSVQAVRSTMAELLRHERPAILPVRVQTTDSLPGHFILLAGRIDEAPLLMNPPAAAFQPSSEWLADHWTGDALLFVEDSSGWSRRGIAASLGVLAAVALLASFVFPRRGRWSRSAHE